MMNKVDQVCHGDDKITEEAFVFRLTNSLQEISSPDLRNTDAGSNSLSGSLKVSMRESYFTVTLLISFRELKTVSRTKSFSTTWAIGSEPLSNVMNALEEASHTCIS